MPTPLPSASSRSALRTAPRRYTTAIAVRRPDPLEQIVQLRIVERPRHDRHRLELQRMRQRLLLPEAEVARAEQDAFPLREREPHALFALPVHQRQLLVLRQRRILQQLQQQPAEMLEHRSRDGAAALPPISWGTRLRDWRARCAGERDRRDRTSGRALRRARRTQRSGRAAHHQLNRSRRRGTRGDVSFDTGARTRAAARRATVANAGSMTISSGTATICADPRPPATEGRQPILQSTVFFGRQDDVCSRRPGGACHLFDLAV